MEGDGIEGSFLHVRFIIAFRRRTLFHHRFLDKERGRGTFHENFVSLKEGRGRIRYLTKPRNNNNNNNNGRRWNRGKFSSRSLHHRFPRSKNLQVFD